MESIYDLFTWSIREAINDRLRTLGVSIHDLAQTGLVRNARRKDQPVAPSTLYRLLDSRDVRSNHLEDIMRACGLALIVVQDVPGWTKKHKK